MCGRFSIISDKSRLAKHFGLKTAPAYHASYNVAPSADIPVIRLHENARELINCRWGLVPHWAKDRKFAPINAKAETLMEKPFFRTAYKNKRCLVPANGFYEWKRMQGGKQPYYFRLADDEILAFAGLWDEWQQEDDQVTSCAIITTEANALMAPVHGRMPVILDPENYDAWLTEGGRELLAPYAGRMVCYPVSKKVNNPKNDGAGLIQAVE